MKTLTSTLGRGLPLALALLTLSGVGLAPARADDRPWIYFSGADHFGQRLVGTDTQGTLIVHRAPGNSVFARIGTVSIQNDTTGSFRVTGYTPTEFSNEGYIQLVFHPSAPGDYSATLVIETNGGNSPHQVQLTGTGITSVPDPTAPWIYFSGADNFGDRPVGVDTKGSLIVHRAPGDIRFARIGTVTVEDDRYGVFRVEDFTKAEFSNEGYIQIVFHPRHRGKYTATLVIETNGANSPHRVPLTGTGVGWGSGGP